MVFDPSVYVHNLVDMDGSWPDTQPIILYAKVGLVPWK